MPPALGNAYPSRQFRPVPAGTMSLPPGTSKQFGRFLLRWLATIWLDVFCMLAVGGITLWLDRVALPVRRTFPLTFTASGDVVDPSIAYPDRGWVISPFQAALIGIVTPIVIYIIAQIRIRNFWDLSAAIMGTLWALLLGTSIQVVLKLLVGGMRPTFLDVCQPDLSLAASRNASGLNGVGYQNIMYSTDICTQTDKRRLRTSLTSFPSGHATVVFSGLCFLSLWINAKFKVWSDHKPAFAKLTFIMLPLLVAALVAGSLTISNAHNLSDILVGAAIGILTALAAYRATYAAIWDWRFNHIPLQQDSPFSYSLDSDMAQKPDTVVKSAGWHQGRRGDDPRPASEWSRGGEV